MYSTITSKGQVTLPVQLREALSLEKGDRIEFVMEEEGRYSIVPITTSLSSLGGCLPKPAKSLSVEDMDKHIRDRFQ